MADGVELRIPIRLVPAERPIPLKKWPDHSYIGDMITFAHIARRGRSKGAVLTPHRGRNGKLAVSPTSRAADQIYVDSLADALPYLIEGHGLRMSCKGRSPSLIKPGFARRPRRRQAA